MDLATLIGIAAGMVCLVVSILLGGSLLDFYDTPSVFIVIGGGMASVLISYRISEIAKVMKVVIKAFISKEADTESTINMLVKMSDKARREGLLALEADLETIDDNFIKQSLQMVVDGIETEVIREYMDLEIQNIQMRHGKGQSIFKTMGALFPAWGMIGTLIGLINLLKALNDPSKIGPAMAVALITTFYGSVIANFVCIPIANKLKLKSDEEIRIKEMIIEGIVSIQAGENPRIMEHKLKLFLPPDRRNRAAAQAGEKAEA
ncbi:MAG: MotA/TolQ/ExbB proton channel family protein [Clostridia bacterium]|nr:MotA/TolQ/ExbB proton channel family protein [Clostridia bacterium]